ncbi:helix-turn-helix XRE-family transcriptional regulators [Candidatus Termititenax aidoneus]|uniref:Helix-turn-helix XRE-family transcriptional regulators n=1 Tax=Termititenax aidoneus TaxID=2218524 RepID=A0A388TC64_TERA1|nr:helix-turn-helix XRE-family transcriptional regulators [Candidatus Termititenax aidoneus]
MTEQLIPHIGKTIRFIRQSKKLSMEEAAFASGISYFYLSKIEHGQCNLTVKVLYQIAHALNVKPTSLLPDGRAASLSDDTPRKKKDVLKMLQQLTNQIKAL